MSLYDYEIRKIKDRIVPEVKTLIKKSASELRDDLTREFRAQQIKKPDIIKNIPHDGAFHRHSKDTAVMVSGVSADITQAYLFNFSTQLATIMTVQNDRVSATETKKLSEMPRKIVNDAQAALRQNTTEQRPTQQKLRRRSS